MKGKATRDILLDAAKRQFIRNGFDAVSMMDIAQESGMSRRTLYTYFESKADVYKAAIDRETSLVKDKLNGIAQLDLPPEKKILKVVFGRFEVVKDMVDHNGTLRGAFFRNSWNLEHFRKDYDQYEKQVLMDVIITGVNQGVFDVANVRLAAEMIQNGLRGFEFPYIRGILWKSYNREEVMGQARRMILGLLGYNETK